MSARALIIAIEDYPLATQLANQLPGTNDGAVAFAEWLEINKQIFPKGHMNYDPASFFCCSSPAMSFNTHGTSASEIIRALQALHRAAADNCTELYCYLAGHGFNYPRTETVQEDIFVASEFVDTATGGRECFKLEELMSLLRMTMGPGDHFYFWDACRTEVDFGTVGVGSLGQMFPKSNLGSAGRAVLFSVEQGVAARTNSGFSKHLIKGLNGAGRAKGWRDDGGLYVTFDRLWPYVESQMKRAVSHHIGDSDGIILKVDPVPPTECRIRIEGADTEHRFTCRIELRGMLVTEEPFKGATQTIVLQSPENYSVTVRSDDVAIVRVTPPPQDRTVDLFEPAEVVYEVIPVGLESVTASPSWPEEVAVQIDGAPNTTIKITGPHGDLAGAGFESLATSLAPGEYRIQLREAGELVGDDTITIEPGGPQNIKPSLLPRSSVHKAIQSKLGQPEAREITFSETLEFSTGDSDLGLWLAYLGASRILTPPKSFSKLSQVSLKSDFSHLPEEKSAIYILHALPELRGPFAIGIGAQPEWVEMTEVAGIPQFFEASLTVSPGHHLLSYQPFGGVPLSLATHVLPGRVTLLTLTPNTGVMPFRLLQYLLPIWSRSNELHPETAKRITSEPLKVMRLLTQIQRLYAREESVWREFGAVSGSGDVAGKQLYLEMTGGDWVDPVGTILAANDLLRLGALNAKSKFASSEQRLRAMIHHLREHFIDLPDTQALCKAIGEPYRVPDSVPLLADSLAAFSSDEQRTFAPISNGRRLFNTPWLAWAGVVEPCYATNLLSDVR